MSHFGIKKVEKCGFFFIYFYFFKSLTTRTGSEMFLTAYSQLNKINQSIKGGRYTSLNLRFYYSTDKFLSLIKSHLQ